MTTTKCLFYTGLFLLLHSTRLYGAEHPNVVFIMADDLGWGDVAFHGGNTPTPTLDRLAESSLELTRHYVAPVCSPTRTGLLTGRCWSRFDVTAPQNERALPWDTITLPRALHTVGYATCLVGKWHLGSLPEQGPNHFGFHHSYGSLAGGVSPWNHRYKQGIFTQTWHRNETLFDEKGHVTDLIANEAIDWLQSVEDQPFFLYVPFTAVHLPVKEPQEWVDRVPAAIHGEVARHYAASVMHLDQAVRRILDAVAAKSVREDTIVVFTSDNGGSTAENNDLKYPDDQCPSGKLPGNNGPFRGEKGSLYEGGTRVPTLVSWPGTIAPGKRDDAVQIIDWMPTFCGLAGVTVPIEWRLDGINLKDYLLDAKQSVPERVLYAVAPNWKARSVHKGAWKLIEHRGSKDNVRYELFNLANDSTEQHNLAEVHPQILQELMTDMERVSTQDKDASVSR
jgi:arylsulfatase A-like enzyme